MSAQQPDAALAPLLREGDVDVSARVLAWLAPIDGPDGAGEDARYEVIYQQVRGEVAGLESPAAACVDWALVIEKAGQLLTNTSKDLSIACHLAYALGVTEGVAGWADAFSLLELWMQRYWATGFPSLQRGRARANAVGWFLERVEPLISSAEVSAADRKTADTLKRAFLRLCDTATRCFGDDVPPLRPIADAIARLTWSTEEHLLAADAHVAAAGAGLESRNAVNGADLSAPAMFTPDPCGTAPAKTSQTLPSDATIVRCDEEVPSLEGTTSLTTFLRKTSQSLCRAAQIWLSSTEPDAKALSVFVAGVYLPVIEMPETLDGVRTNVAPCPAPIIEQLEQNVRELRWERVTRQVMWALPKHRLALDLHYYLDRSLRERSAPFEAASRAHLGELRALLARFPRLPELTFKDRTPLASAQTKRWLSDVVLPRFVEPLADRRDDGSACSSEQGQTALDLIRCGQADEGVRLLQRCIATAPSTRERFSRRHLLAKGCENLKAWPLACALFEQLAEDIQRHSLELWEPQLSAGVYRDYHRCLGNVDESGQRRGDILERLCRLDPAEALELIGTQ